jgi:hypothetical protein
MRALVVTLKFDEIKPATEATIEKIASALAAVDGLLSTYWLRTADRVMLIQSLESHRAVNAYLESDIFAALGRIPGSRDVFVTHSEVSTKLNGLSVLGSLVGTRELERELVPA